MNDLLALEPEENIQDGAFHLSTALKRDVKGEGMLGGDMAPVTSEADSGPVVSVGGTALSGGGSTAGQMMQTSMTTPLIVLTTNASGDVEASVLVDPSASVSGAGPWSSLQLSNLHSLAQANLISDTRQEIAKQLSAQGKEEGREGRKAKKQKEEEGGGSEKLCPKVQFANDLRKDLEQERKTAGRAGPKKQIAIFEAQPSEPKTFVCKVKGCGRQFAWQAHFKYHQLAHTNDRRFVCNEVNCGKKFLTAQRLQVHKRTHTGERPYVCPAQDCGKSFTTAGNLKNHSRVHTGERPFACEVDGCGRRFAEYSSLHKHSLTHSGDKPFTCEICGKKFSQSGSRRVHVNRHKLDSAKAIGVQEVTGTDLDDNANIDDGDFKTDMSGKVDPDSVLCRPHEDNLHYQDLHNAQSVVFPQGLTDHIVTVTTQPPDPNTDALEMPQDILGAEVLVEGHMSEPQGESSVVVLSQPSPMDPLHSPLTPTSYPLHQKVLTQTVDYDLHPHLHHEEISTAHPPDHQVLTSYPSLDPTGQPSHHAHTVAEEIEVSVSSSSSSHHPQSGQAIHMDPMMESDEEFDAVGKDIS
ncbi:uncharacterized protein LOC143296448 isoform X2 [Babylonia areolata]|uniref:uncharacterized protein LOC143296448 isoform X2 n=1 Tax=Babylonia areolata TaxID=304850 RepID=UPI003FCF28B8